MWIVLLPILYFVLLFGFYEAFIFKRSGAYWKSPFLTASYFLTATIGALLIFSFAPLQLVLASSLYEISAVAGLYIVLAALAMHGYFTYHPGESTNKSSAGRKESFRYVFAKSTDILFQDTLAVIVILAMQQVFPAPATTIALFTIYFFFAHVLLLAILPIRYAAIFALASVFAGIAFASIVVFDLGIVYIFILHWAFYAVMYSPIKKIRKKVWDVPQTL